MIWKLPNCAQVRVKSLYYGIHQQISFQKQKFLDSSTRDILFAILVTLMNTQESQLMNANIYVRYLISANTSITHLIDMKFVTWILAWGEKHPWQMVFLDTSTAQVKNKGLCDILLIKCFSQLHNGRLGRLVLSHVKRSMWKWHLLPQKDSPDFRKKWWCLY